MKNKLQLALLITSFSLLLFSACKKSTNDITKLDFTEESTTHSDDQSTFTNETDALANDFNTIVDNYVAFNGREANTLAIPCDATVSVDSISSPRRITITYNGSNCVPFRTRTGTVVITMPANVRWRDSGAIMTVNMQNVKITRTGTNRSITINGIKTIRNVTGGLIRQVVMPGVTVIHEIRSNNMSVRFADSTSRTWQIARRRGFTFNNGLTITTRGIATVDGINEVAEWGTNRYGNEFITATSEPLIVRQNCAFRLTSGQVKHHKMSSLVTVTFGLDSTGAPTTCPMNAPFYFKMVYTGANNVTRTVIRPYN
jgi:hypothetical protein